MGGESDSGSEVTKTDKNTCTEKEGERQRYSDRDRQRQRQREKQRNREAERWRERERRGRWQGEIKRSPPLLCQSELGERKAKGSQAELSFHGRAEDEGKAGVTILRLAPPE